MINTYLITVTSSGSSLILLFILAPIVALALLLLNYLFSQAKPDMVKISPFECGFSSFSQTRSPFHVHFFLVALLFLVFDLEIALVYPYVVSTSYNASYGLWAVIIFLAILTAGFVFEIGKKALAFHSN